MEAGKNLIYRPAESGDLAAIQEIEERSFTSPWDAGFLKEIQQDRMQQMNVLVSGESLVGYIVYWLIGNEGHISNVAVHPDFRGKGFGKNLLQRVVAECVARKVTRLILEVNEHNETAVNMYQSFGFEYIGRRKKYYENRDDALVLILNL